MKRNYDECVTKYSDSFVRVVLDPGYVSRIQNFVTELVEAKAKEDHHKIDSNKEVKRFTTGFLGEAALEKLFGIPIINWTIGYSGLYHIPDIPGYRVGIKTVERDKFPIIFKDNSYPQIAAGQGRRIYQKLERDFFVWTRFCDQIVVAPYGSRALFEPLLWPPRRCGPKPAGRFPPRP